MRSDDERLADILEAIARIERYTRQGRQAFRTNELIQTWVLHHLQILGEAVRGLSEAFRAQAPQVPWDEIIGMRNILVHHYFGIDEEVVWAVVERDLPLLRRSIEALTGRPSEERPGSA